MKWTETPVTLFRLHQVKKDKETVEEQSRACTVEGEEKMKIDSRLPFWVGGAGVSKRGVVHII